jgi:ribonuclease inhibitor
MRTRLAVKIVIDGRAISYESDFHCQIAKALDLKCYGRNLDALWDILSGGVERPFAIVWMNSSWSRDQLGSVFDSIVRIFDKAIAQDERWGLVEPFEYILE